MTVRTGFSLRRWPVLVNIVYDLVYIPGTIKLNYLLFRHQVKATKGLKLFNVSVLLGDHSIVKMTNMDLSYWIFKSLPSNGLLSVFSKCLPHSSPVSKRTAKIDAEQESQQSVKRKEATTSDNDRTRVSSAHSVLEYFSSVDGANNWTHKHSSIVLWK